MYSTAFYRNGGCIIIFDKIVDYEHERVDIFISKSCKYYCAFLSGAWLLNQIGIFAVKKTSMTIIWLSSMLLMLIPVILIKKSKLNKNRLRYIISTIILLNVSLLYSFLTFHTLLLFVYPLILMSVYGNRKINRYTIMITCAALTLSHFVSYFTSIVPEEPFRTIKGIFIFGLIPRLIEIIMFSMSINYITVRNAGMLGAINLYSSEMYQTQEELVRAFAEISESKSGQTGHHVKRVAAYTDIIANRLGINGKERESLGIASMMHDIGKLMILSRSTRSMVISCLKIRLAE